MIAKRYRFHGYSALRFVYTKGTTVRNKGLTLRYAQNKHRAESRLAVVVSKKVAKRAPVRNRIRRRIYESVRQRWAMILPGYDLVISVFDQDVAEIPAEKIDHMVDDVLQKAKLIKH